MPRHCPECESIYGDSTELCPRDGTELEPFDPEDDPLLGVVIDERFRLEELLGAGGMGRVYRGLQISVDRNVAVKLLRGEAVPDRKMRERFFREARVISGFSHPNIVRLIDFGTDPERGVPYLVMELAGGVSLGDLLETGRLRPDLAVEIARQVCSGLLEAHSANIVHRDLKPDNLHLIPVSDGSFQVKLLDFGIAFPQDASKNLTATGMMCGTATYVAPEQARGHEVDGQADLYSLGIILYQMLSGLLPFKGDSGFEIIMKHVQEPPPPLDDFVPPELVPDDLVELVHDLLAKDSAERPSGPGKVRNRLESVATQLDFSPIELDLNLSGKALFQSWILPTAPDDAPIHESDTLGEEAASSGLPPQSDSDRDPPVRSGHTEIADSRPSADSDSQPKAPQVDRSMTSGPEAADGPSNLRRGLGITALVAGFALLAAGAYYVVQTRQADDDKTDKGALVTADEDAASPDASESDDDEKALAKVTEPLNDFAGRCVVVGTSSADFHTVYFYPEVGELLLRGDESLRWSKLDVLGQRGSRIEFKHGATSGGNELRGTVRKSADKRIFEFESDDNFVCRREAYPAYYTDLDLEGEYEADDGDGHLEFPAAGQRFTRTTTEAGEKPASFIYRLLDGQPGTDKLKLAVRKKSRETSDWNVWKLTRADGELEVEYDGESFAYKMPDQQDRSPDNGRSSAGSSTGGTASAHDSKPTAVQKPAPRPTNRKPKKLSGDQKKKLDRFFERCHATHQKYQRELKNYQEGIRNAADSKERERLRTHWQETVEEITAKRKAQAREYSSIVQAIAMGGTNTTQIQRINKRYQKECYGQ